MTGSLCGSSNMVILCRSVSVRQGAQAHLVSLPASSQGHAADMRDEVSADETGVETLTFRMRHWSHCTVESVRVRGLSHANYTKDLQMSAEMLAHM